MDIREKARRALKKTKVTPVLGAAEAAMLARLRAGERITTGPETGGGLRLLLAHLRAKGLADFSQVDAAGKPVVRGQGSVGSRSVWRATR